MSPTDAMLLGIALVVLAVLGKLFGPRLLHLARSLMAEDLARNRRHHEQLFRREGPYRMAVEHVEAEIEPVEDLPQGGAVWRGEVFADRASAEEVRYRHVIEEARAFYEERDREVLERALAARAARRFRFGQRR